MVTDIDINDLIEALKNININLDRIAKALESIDKNGIETYVK